MLHLDLPRAPKETWATLWRKFRASYAVHRWMKRQRRPCWRTRSGWGGSLSIYIYIYVCVCVPGEKIWGCNVVNPCKPNHRPPILEALSIGWGRKWSDDWHWWPLAWVKRIPPNVWKIPGIAELHMQKLLCFPCVLQTIENARVFLGGKTCWCCFVWEIVHHFREFFSEAAVFPVFLLRGK